MHNYCLIQIGKITALRRVTHRVPLQSVPGKSTPERYAMRTLPDYSLIFSDDGLLYNCIENNNPAFAQQLTKIVTI